MEASKELNLAVFSIVVLGNMNPAIHQPYWYKDVGILTEEETKSAIELPVFCLPHFAHFKLPPIEITCQVVNWQITVSSDAAIDRAVNIASRTFDRLYDTPVSAFGLNFMFQVDVGIENIASYLASSLASTRLGLPPNGKSAQLTYSIAGENVRYNLNMAPSDINPNMLQVSINAHHDIISTTSFKMEPLFTAAIEIDLPFAKKCLDDIIAATKAVTEAK